MYMKQNPESLDALHSCRIPDHYKVLQWRVGLSECNSRLITDKAEAEAT